MNLPTGVEMHGKTIRICFVYRGARCREVLKGWMVTNSNIKKAGILRATIVSEIQQGKFDYAAHFPESKAVKKFITTRRVKTFKELCDFFTDAKELEVSNATLLSIKSSVNTLCRVVGESTHLSDIQHADLLDYRKLLLHGPVVNPSLPNVSKAGRAPSTVNKHMALLTEMLKLANRSQYITHKPYDGVLRLKVSKRDPDPLSLSELRSMLDTLPENLSLILVVSVYTGMRPGELCALAWDDVDLNKGEVHVCRSLTNKGLFVPPKTDAGIRTITLLQPAIDAFKRLFLISGELDKREIRFHHREIGRTEVQKLRFVFVPPAQYGKNNGYYAKHSMAYPWNRATELSGIRERNPYQSRHTFACWTLMAGANPSFIASQMGHEDARMVYEVYSKWIGDMDKDQVAMLNGRIPSHAPQERPKQHATLKKVV